MGSVSQKKNVLFLWKIKNSQFVWRTLACILFFGVLLGITGVVALRCARLAADCIIRVWMILIRFLALKLKLTVQVVHMSTGNGFCDEGRATSVNFCNHAELLLDVFIVSSEAAWKPEGNDDKMTNKPRRLSDGGQYDQNEEIEWLGNEFEWLASSLANQEFLTCVGINWASTSVKFVLVVFVVISEAVVSVLAQQTVVWADIAPLKHIIFNRRGLNCYFTYRLLVWMRESLSYAQIVITSGADTALNAPLVCEVVEGFWNNSKTWGCLVNYLLGSWRGLVLGRRRNHGAR